MPVLAVETPRLLLRLPKLSDAEPFMEIFWDPEVVEKKQVTTSPPGDIDLARRQTATLINHWELRGFGLWTVVEKATGQIIGSVGLQNWKG